MELDRLASKTLQVIKETGLTDLKYHRHCFTGTYEELLEWRSLPHVRFGVTWKTVTDRAKYETILLHWYQIKETIVYCPTRRIVWYSV
jgi:Tat protein secretion system quality control protein TatD with DNase activity